MPDFMQCKNVKTDCFANRKGACRALSDTSFTNKDGTYKPCPFYKQNKDKSEESL